MNEVDAQLQSVANDWDAAVDTNAARQGIFDRMNELLNRRSYIRNLIAGVEKELQA